MIKKTSNHQDSEKTNTCQTNAQRTESLARRAQHLFTLAWRQCYGNDVIRFQHGRYAHCETTEVAVAQSLNFSFDHKSNGVRCKCWQRSAAALTRLISAITHSQAARVELWRWNSSVALCGLPYVNNIMCKTHHFPAVTYAALCVFNYVARVIFQPMRPLCIICAAEICIPKCLLQLHALCNNSTACCFATFVIDTIIHK